jgi:hypothetical protein
MITHPVKSNQAGGGPMAAQSRTSELEPKERREKRLVALVALLVLIISVPLFLNALRRPVVPPSFTRIGGHSRVETAAEAAHFWPRRPMEMVAAIRDEPGEMMLKAAADAAARDAPLLFIPRSKELPTALQQLLKDRPQACIRLSPGAENTKLIPKALHNRKCPSRSSAPSPNPTNVPVVAWSQQPPPERMSLSSTSTSVPPTSTSASLLPAVGGLNVVQPQDWKGSTRLIFATAQHAPDLPDVAVAVALAAHLNSAPDLRTAPDDERFTVIVLPRYLQAEQDLAEVLRKHGTRVNEALLIGGSDAISDSLREVLKTTIVPLDSQKRWLAVREIIEKVGAFAVPVLILLIAAKKSGDLLEKKGHDREDWGKLPGVIWSSVRHWVSSRRRQHGPSHGLSDESRDSDGRESRDSDGRSDLVRPGVVRMHLKSPPRWVGGIWTGRSGGRDSPLSLATQDDAVHFAQAVDCDPETGAIRIGADGNPVLRSDGLVVPWSEVQYLEYIETTRERGGKSATPTSPTPSRSPTLGDMPEGRSRALLQQRVRQVVDEAAINGAPHINLTFQFRPDMVQPLFSASSLPKPDREGSAPPRITSIIHAFTQANEALLILGAPGSGKTTALLELARELLRRSEHDLAYPVPVVLDASSWNGARRFADWMEDELLERYQVPKTVSHSWIEGERILPLVDNLDAVAPKHREGCVEAIRAFREEHGFLPIAVCSRTEDDSSLGVLLRLRGVVSIQPLELEQAFDYLRQQIGQTAGDELFLLEHFGRLQRIPWELLHRSPLSLGAMTLAIQRNLRAVGANEAPEQWRQQLLATYVELMLERPSRFGNRREQMMRWLAWLAASMTRHQQSVFYPTVVGPEWLATTQQRRVVTIRIRVSCSLLVGLLAGLALAASGLPLTGVFGGPLATVAYWLLRRLQDRDLDPTGPSGSRRSHLWSWAHKSNIIYILGLLTGVAGIVVAIWSLWGPITALSYGLLLTVILILEIGGYEILVDLSTRLWLRRSGLVPSNYAEFLEDAWEHGFLYKIDDGDIGYTFVHPILMEHFASLEASVTTA